MMMKPFVGTRTGCPGNAGWLPRAGCPGSGRSGRHQQLVQRQNDRSATGVAAAGGIDTVSVVVHVGVGAALLTAVGASLASPRKTSAASPGGADADSDEFEDSVRWSVMAVLSFLPYFNFASWAFAAVDSMYGDPAPDDDESNDDRGDDASYYWSLAFLYAVPYVVDGFRLDAFTWLSVAVGAAHVQVERARYYRADGEALLPDVNLAFLRRLRLPRVTFPRIDEAVRVDSGGGRRGAGSAAPGDAAGEDEVEDEVDRLLAERARDELSDFDRRLRDRSRPPND